MYAGYFKDIERAIKDLSRVFERELDKTNRHLEKIQYTLKSMSERDRTRSWDDNVC